MASGQTVPAGPTKVTLDPGSSRRRGVTKILTVSPGAAALLSAATATVALLIADAPVTRNGAETAGRGSELVDMARW